MSEQAAWYAAPLLAAFAGAAALAAVQVLARRAIAANWLPDHPNHRSSHERVTPRSGGVAIFVAWLAGLAVVAGLGTVEGVAGQAAMLAPLVGLVFLFGLVDDILALRAAWKFIGQMLAALVYVWVFGPLETAPLPFLGDAPLGLAGAPITVFWIVAFMNAFNFMDGVNGIAAACAAFALFGIAVASAFFSAGLWTAAAGVGAVALVGFLPFNFSKDKLFMGDNGSQTIGFLIAAAGVGAANASDGALSALFAPVAMAAFIVDVAFTLVHRTIRKQNILLAHREHVYQLLLRLGLSHVAVTAIYLGLTAFSTAAAIAMLRLSPEHQWIAPVFLIAAFSIPAGLIFAKAERAGLLSGEPQSDLGEEGLEEAALAMEGEPLGAGVSYAAE